MSYLLDTNLISELRRPSLANEGVISWVAGVTVSECNISVLTLFELEAGTRKAERSSPDLGRALRRWLDGYVLPNYLERAIAIDTPVALRASTFERALAKDVVDHLIAATAVEHDLVLVSRNVRHLQHPGVRLLNPFT